MAALEFGCVPTTAKRPFHAAFLLLLVCFLLDTDSAFSFVAHPMASEPALQSLVPSQVTSSFKSKRGGKSTKAELNAATPDQAGNVEGILVPAQVKVSSTLRQKQHRSSGKRGGGKAVTAQKQAKEKNCQAKVADEKSKEKSQQQAANVQSDHETKASGKVQQQNQNRQRRRPINGNNRNKRGPRGPSRFGNLPDIEWGSVSMDHLRLHPRFVPLPLPEDLPLMQSLEDCKYIRQDSWQWDALHDGRCTTSQAVAALGFLEKKAAKMLGIPSTWQRRGLSAYYRLQQPALRTLEEMNKVLLAENTLEGNPSSLENKRKQESTRLWKENNGASKGNAFAAEYLKEFSNRKRKQRKHRSITYSVTGVGIRMLWGNCQEATSVLTALNYFTEKEPNVIVKEIGMCGAGLAINRTDDGNSLSSLLIGATPDAVVEHSDGSTEVLEVKNHCPFVLSRPPKKKGVRHKNFTIRELPFRQPYIFPLYVPQLQLEMNCLGPECRSAVMVRQTATNGALVLRIHRDDEWIEEMLYWLQRFQQDFVEKEQEPMANFFYDSPTDGPRYLSFLEWTKEIANQVDLVDRIPHKAIQRSNPVEPFFLD